MNAEAKIHADRPLTGADLDALLSDHDVLLHYVARDLLLKTLDARRAHLATLCEELSAYGQADVKAVLTELHKARPHYGDALPEPSRVAGERAS